jgi:hypothetical protein
LEPLPVISLEYAPPDAARRFHVALPVCEALGVAACAIAFALLFPEVELVLATGPLIFVIGAAMVGMGVHRRDWPRIALGAGHLGICALLIALVNLLNWSPLDADVPFKWIGGCYLVATVGASVARLVHTRVGSGDASLPPATMSSSSPPPAVITRP